MKILVNHDFVNKLEGYKKTLRQFELTELENFLTLIESNPQLGETDPETKLIERVLENDYFFCVVIYEFRNKMKELILVSIELLKK